MYEARNKFLTAGTTENFFPFLHLLYAYMQNMYFLPEHRDMGLLCFQAGHLFEWTDFSSAPIFTESHYPKQGLWQTGAGLDLLPALMSKIINLNGSIWPKHLKIRNISNFHL